MTTWLAIHSGPDGDTVLGFDPGGGPCGCYPLRPFYVELASGLRHWYRSEPEARRSQYWGRIERADTAGRIMES